MQDTKTFEKRYKITKVIHTNFLFFIKPVVSISGKTLIRVVERIEAWPVGLAGNS